MEDGTKVHENRSQTAMLFGFTFEEIKGGYRAGYLSRGLWFTVTAENSHRVPNPLNLLIFDDLLGYIRKHSYYQALLP